MRQNLYPINPSDQTRFFSCFNKIIIKHNFFCKYLILLVMSKRKDHRRYSSKLYHPNDMSLAQNNDMSHQKIWNQKVQQAKHVQQQKQIDKMFQCLIKERLFGKLLAEDGRISIDGYHTLDKYSKDNVNPPKLPSPRKIKPLLHQPEYSRLDMRKSKFSTIDVVDRSNNESRGNSYRQDKKSRQIQGRKGKKTYNAAKLILLSKFPNFPNHFKMLNNNKSSMIYDLKMNKQMLHKHNKETNLVSQELLEKGLFFFNFPASVNDRQYRNWVESTVNCTYRQISFFIFQCLDASHNGFLTISDLFIALQNFPNNNFIQKQIYRLKQLISKTTEQLKQRDSTEIKATVEDYLVVNHNLKIQILRDLLKNEDQDLIPASCIKSTSYHKSMYALEHDANVRAKNNQLQNASTVQPTKKNIMKQDGLRYEDYAKEFTNKRSFFFCLFMELLTGEDASIFE